MTQAFSNDIWRKVVVVFTFANTLAERGTLKVLITVWQSSIASQKIWKKCSKKYNHAPETSLRIFQCSKLATLTQYFTTKPKNAKRQGDGTIICYSLLSNKLTQQSSLLYLKFTGVGRIWEQLWEGEGVVPPLELNRCCSWYCSRRSAWSSRHGNRCWSWSSNWSRNRRSMLAYQLFKIKSIFKIKYMAPCRELTLDHVD